MAANPHKEKFAAIVVSIFRTSSLTRRNPLMMNSSEPCASEAQMHRQYIC